MEPIGEHLQEARRNKRASLEDASRATRIKIEILQQLEADEFDRLAAPTYTKGFLRLYAEYLGLDGQRMVEAYLASQGGLRRQGLHMETEKAIHARKPPELRLPLGSVGLAVVGVTVVVFAVVLGKNLFTHHAPKPISAVAEVTVPKADFDAYYQPKPRPAPELAEPTANK
jgi:cytoskeletal protein RodZ